MSTKNREPSRSFSFERFLKDHLADPGPGSWKERFNFPDLEGARELEVRTYTPGVMTLDFPGHENWGVIQINGETNSIHLKRIHVVGGRAGKVVVQDLYDLRIPDISTRGVTYSPEELREIKATTITKTLTHIVDLATAA